MGDSTESSGTDSTTESKSNESKDVETENKLENKEENQDVKTEEKTSINSNAGISSDDNKNGYMDSSNITYEGDKCIYTDPSNKSRYTWNEEKKEWVAEQPQQPDPTTGNSDYQFDGSTYTYKDKITNVEYKWDIAKNSWLSLSADGNMETDDKIKEPAKTEQTTSSNTAAGKDRPSSQYCPETDTYTYTDPSDNTVYLWDRHKSAWFPKVDDDFMAQYQMNYGFVDPNADSSEDKKVTEEKEEVKNDEGKGEKRKAQQQPPTWFEIDETSNTKVYVSNLPLDITEKEFVDLMQKCGLVMKDVETNKMKVKLYTEKGTSHLKGDGLCTYIKKESVDLALNLLDGYELKGKKLKVERAKFTMKGDSYDPSLKPKKRKKKELEKIKKMQEKLFDWRPDKLRGERSRNESVVIVKNLFDPAIFDKDVKLILEFQQELREECLKCGDLKRVIIYDKHPEGVAQVNFKLPEAADACVLLLNGRWYNKRKITAETWDGKTKYKIIETDEELKKRLANWDQFLHTGSESKPDNKNNETAADVKSDTNQASDTDNGKTNNNENTDVVSQKNTGNENNSVSGSGDKKVIDRDSDQDTKSIDSEYSTEDEEDLK